MTAEKTDPIVWTEPPAETNITYDTKAVSELPDGPETDVSTHSIEAALGINIDTAFQDIYDNFAVSTDELYAHLIKEYDNNNPEAEQYALAILKRYFPSKAPAIEPYHTNASEELLQYENHIRSAATAACWVIANNRIESRNRQQDYRAPNYDVLRDQAINAMDIAKTIPIGSSRKEDADTDGSTPSRDTVSQESFLQSMRLLRDRINGLDTETVAENKATRDIQMGRAVTLILEEIDALGGQRLRTSQGVAAAILDGSGISPTEFEQTHPELLHIV